MATEAQEVILRLVHVKYDELGKLLALLDTATCSDSSDTPIGDIQTALRQINGYIRMLDEMEHELHS